MLGELDEIMKNLLHILRRKEGVVNTVMADATAKAFITRSHNEHLKCVDLDSSYWANSLFRRIVFTKRACTTSKPEILEKGSKANISTSNR